jgi:hypothetical protein
MREFIAPLPIAAVALMVVNDRLGKPYLHNEVSGKLSDVAVCFFLPLYLSAVLGLLWWRHPRARLLVACTVAGLFYLAQEIWPAFARLFLAALRVVGAPLGLDHFALTSDATDLLTLFMVPLAYAYGSCRLSKTPSQAAPIATQESGSCPQEDR